MKNNRCGPHAERGAPRQRSDSRGDPPAICGTSGDPPWMFASRGDPPIIRNCGDQPEMFQTRGHPPEVQNKLVNSLNYELKIRIIGCQNRLHGRGMSKSEQPSSRSPKGESISF